MLACPICESTDIGEYDSLVLECYECGEIFSEDEAEIVDEETPEYLAGLDLLDDDIGY